MTLSGSLFSRTGNYLHMKVAYVNVIVYYLSTKTTEI
jgi:hypothetical protein